MTDPAVPNDQLTAVLDVVQSVLGPDVEGAYLYGSAVMGGLHPASDLDFLVIVGRTTTQIQRRGLVHRLTPISSRALRPPSWRPVELTVVVGSEIRPWRYPPLMEFQYGEWMRREFKAGIVPSPRANPDLAVLMSIVREASRPLVGPPAPALLAAVPTADLSRAMVAGVPDLLADVETDTTNVLLTLARIWQTLETSEFSPKDAAADWALGQLPIERRPSLEHARDVYRGAQERWDTLGAAIAEDAAQLVNQIERTVQR